MRRAAKKDNAQSEIVKGLRAAGYSVTVLNQEGIPDLMVAERYWPAGMFKLLETKSKRNKDGSITLDKRQEKQIEFCRAHGVPYVTTLQEALEALE